MKKRSALKMWVVAASMGYGHLRAAYPLKKFTRNGPLAANHYPGIPASDLKVWSDIENFYNFISRFKAIPIIGLPAFKCYDKFQAVPKFVPGKDMRRPSFQAVSNDYLIRKKGWGRDLIARASRDPVPFVAPFFTASIMAEQHGYPGPIFTIPTDSDIGRAWAPLDPARSRIRYLAPTERVVQRLQLYGVPKEMIHFTGFPLPDENIGPSGRVLRRDLAARLVNLDPGRKFFASRGREVLKELGLKSLPAKSGHPLTVMFAIGGAGAQKELAADIINGFSRAIREKRIRLYLIAGVYPALNEFFTGKIAEAGLSGELGKGVRILCVKDKQAYFAEFNRWLHTTDVLWTKPSELSFYAGLALPILMAPTIGSQEVFNKEWLLSMSAGICQGPPKKIDRWFFEWLEEGRFAEAAFNGYLKAPRDGTANIEKVVSEVFRRHAAKKTG
jgi:hypothetical protein